MVEQRGFEPRARIFLFAVLSQNLNPDVLMMEASEDWYRCYGPSFGGRRKSGAFLSNERFVRTWL